MAIQKLEKSKNREHTTPLQQSKISSNNEQLLNNAEMTASLQTQSCYNFGNGMDFHKGSQSESQYDGFPYGNPLYLNEHSTNGGEQPTHEDSEVNEEQPTHEDSEGNEEQPTHEDSEGNEEQPTHEDSEVNEEQPTHEDSEGNEEQPTHEDSEVNEEQPTHEDSEVSCSPNQGEQLTSNESEFLILNPDVGFHIDQDIGLYLDPGSLFIFNDGRNILLNTYNERALIIIKTNIMECKP
ncbi:Constitutive coactivator of peroxisome like protein [Argiope bruennichi]|uniref:Constitutive coactivator of peroxisome like protein n=1 Tax=Argiope bruennichi TaxID=94029 RepID=A0A8T0FP75_ARGBR|nr:Constitutive coactivator of peroxisome like protein [Argiope bruennichi]